MVVERQRDDLEAPLGGMNDKSDSAQEEVFVDSNSTERVVSGEKLEKSVSVPTFAVETIHEPQGSTLQAI